MVGQAKAGSLEPRLGLPLGWDGWVDLGCHQQPASQSVCYQEAGRDAEEPGLIPALPYGRQASTQHLSSCITNSHTWKNILNV